jgi:Tat protein translocase TatB subunit
MLNIGPQELILVLIIALVIVGPRRLPELGRSIGRALREFRKIQDDVKDTIKFDLRDEEPHAPRPGSTRAVGNGEVAREGTDRTATPEAGSDTEGDAEPRAAE